MSFKTEFEDHEKIERFDRIREECLRVWNERMSREAFAEDEDNEHWVYEAAMQATLSSDDIKDFWHAFNNRILP